MGSSSPSLKCKLNCLVDLHQPQQAQSPSSGKAAKIQKVPPYLRERSEFNKYYFPKVVSIGPIHHPKGEEYKEMWATMYLQQQGDAQNLLEQIRFHIKELKECYPEDMIQGLDDDKLTWILFVDGCAALHVMGKVDSPKLQPVDIIVLQDLLLLENQLPFEVLKMISNGDDSALERFVDYLHKNSRSFQQFEVKTYLFKTDDHQHHSPHLLDLLMTFIVVVDCDKQTEDTKICCLSIKDETGDDDKPPTHRNVQELITSGIKIKRKDQEKLTRIRFKGGTLYIPPLTVDDFTAQTFMNMIAYEMCPDNSKTKYEISNYMSFLNSLIDDADDVKKLRKARVVNNLLGSDEEVAKIFNTVSNDLVFETGIYRGVRKDIEKLYTHKWRVWFVELWHNHFHTPWKFIGLITAILAFMLVIVELKEGIMGSKK